MFSWTGQVETCVLLYHKDYTVGEKGKKVTVKVGMDKKERNQISTYIKGHLLASAINMGGLRKLCQDVSFY